MRARAALAAAAAVTAAAFAAPRQEARPETAWRAVGAIQPRLSPDGETVAVSYQGAIARIPAAGGALRRLTNGPGFEVDPAWSPDGKTLAYLDGTAGELRRIDAASGAPVPLPKAVFAQGPFFFAPDGRRLLGRFRAERAQPHLLAWCDLETGDLKAVRPQPLGFFDPYALAPEGDRILYGTSQDLPGEQTGMNGPQYDLWVVAAGGGEPRKLVRIASRVYGLWWGRDGVTLVTSLGGAHHDLWSLSVDAPDHAHKLTFGQADEDSPSTSADGRRMVYTDNRENATALVVRDVETGRERTLEISRIDFGAPAGTVSLETALRSTGQPAPARVSFRRAGGRAVAPPGALYHVTGPDEYFYAPGKVRFAAPAGRYTVRAFRGIEFSPAEQEVEVPAGGEVSVRVALERWTNPPANGWFGGETHIHANYGYGQWYNTPETIRLRLEAEGLHVGNLVVANSDTDGVFDREFFRGAPDARSGPETILYWNEEFRATLWGHLTLLNLKHLVEPIFTGFKDTTHPYDVPTNADIADHTHAQGGHVNFTHPYSNVADPYLSAYSAKSLPVDAALGKIDTLDLNLGWDATVAVWHRMLNCGVRLGPSAGTDVFLNRIRCNLPGWARAYVKLPGGLDYARWVEGLRAGRSFVTSGPMLEFSAEKKTGGETVALPGPAGVSVKAFAGYRTALDRLDLVYNGKVIARGELSADRLQATLSAAAEIGRSGWLAARAFAGDRTQAHSSPVYVEVAGRPAASKADAEYFLAWIDRLEEHVRKRDRFTTPASRAHVAAQLEQARAFYRKAADER
jgi:hypothetical protein